MRPSRRETLRPLALIAAVAAPLLAGACAGDGEREADAAADARPDSAAYLRPAEVSRQAVLDSLPMDTIDGHPSWTEMDWQILREVTGWAWSEGVDTLEVPDAVAAIGERFVGAPYVPYTLEAEGPERLVVNLRALDCVTFVENMVALAWFVRAGEPEVLEDQDRAMALYERFLTDLRYRDGTIAGYPSRLHYFTEWMADNSEMGLVRERTRELGGIPTDEPIDFMTSHRESYRQLGEQANWDRIREIERELSAMDRWWIPQDSIPAIEDRIRTGDVIAATSTVEGLDVAHTGLALWRDGRLHLMHAPLVGEDVQISEVPLSQRILRIDGQDGIKVATPLPHPSEGS